MRCSEKGVLATEKPEKHQFGREVNDASVWEEKVKKRKQPEHRF
jgi:hypothetical protein